MHRAAPGIDWRSIEDTNAKESYKKRIQLRKSLEKSSTENFANGDLEGEWFERGNKDQSGSIRRMDYDLDTDKIYAISDGSGVYEGAAKVISEGQVQAGSNVIFQGEDCVELNAGFEVKAGANFVGEIEDCDQ